MVCWGLSVVCGVWIYRHISSVYEHFHWFPPTECLCVSWSVSWLMFLACHTVKEFTGPLQPADNHPGVSMSRIMSLRKACQSVSMSAQCPHPQTMGGNVTRVTDRPVGHFRPCTACPPLPSIQRVLNCVQPTARPAYWLGFYQSKAAQTAHFPERTIKWARSHSECHILLLFNEFFIVCCLAESLCLLSALMSFRFQLQHERVFAQLFSVISHPSSWNSGKVNAVSNPSLVLLFFFNHFKRSF